MEAARARAEADKAQLEEALAKNGGDLKAAAGDREFAQLPAFSLNDIDKQSAVVTSIQQSKHISLRECAGELEKVKAAGAFLAPRRAEQSFSIGQGFQGIVIPMGYQLLYVSERTAPPAEESTSPISATGRNGWRATFRSSCPIPASCAWMPILRGKNSLMTVCSRTSARDTPIFSSARRW